MGIFLVQTLNGELVQTPVHQGSCAEVGFSLLLAEYNNTNDRLILKLVTLVLHLSCFAVVQGWGFLWF